MERQTKKPVIHQADVVPVVSFAFPRQVAKPVSKNPAMINNIQFIENWFTDYDLPFLSIAFMSKQTGL